MLYVQNENKNSKATVIQCIHIQKFRRFDIIKNIIYRITVMSQKSTDSFVPDIRTNLTALKWNKISSGKYEDLENTHQ